MNPDLWVVGPNRTTDQPAVTAITCFPGIALVASKAFPDYRDVILTVTIGTTVAFELLGPAASLFAIRKATAANNAAGVT